MRRVRTTQRFTATPRELLSLLVAIALSGCNLNPVPEDPGLTDGDSVIGASDGVPVVPGVSMSNPNEPVTGNPSEPEVAGPILIDDPGPVAAGGPQASPAETSSPGGEINAPGTMPTSGEPRDTDAPDGLASNDDFTDAGAPDGDGGTQDDDPATSTAFDATLGDAGF